jgi:hypothetical protein
LSVDSTLLGDFVFFFLDIYRPKPIRRNQFVASIRRVVKTAYLSPLPTPELSFGEGPVSAKGPTLKSVES